MKLHEKLNALKAILKDMESVAIAFSGGVDSTFLLKVAKDVLNDKVIAVTARSSTYPEREFKEAKSFSEKLGVKHIIIVSEELDIDGFSNNPTNRCYYCKKELFTKIIDVAKEHNIKYVVDGSNIDDNNDYRPGLKAINELGILSPLKQAGISKDDIRVLSREMELPTWDKQAFACLASRFPYGNNITKEKLEMVDHAEQFLLDMGFKQVRVRHHGEVARIEVSAFERTKFFDEELMNKVYSRFKDIGFAYTALDLKGYRTGSMNETILTDREA